MEETPTGVDADGVVTRKPFSQFLIEQRNGGLHGEISDALADLVAAVQDVGKGGTLTLTISVKPGESNTQILVVADDVRVKAPVAPKPASIYFADDAGNLSRSNPNQPELPLRRVDGGGQGNDDLRRAAQ